MFGSRHGRKALRHSFERGAAAALIAVLFAHAPNVTAAWVGMLADNAGEHVSVFNADTDQVQAGFDPRRGKAVGDCAVSSDQRVGVSTNSDSLLFFLDLQAQGAPVSQVRISNLGVDMALSPDNAFVVAVGGGALGQPLSVISVGQRREVTTSELFLDHTSVEFCDDGTLLVTTNNGEYFQSDSGLALYDARLDEAGRIGLLGDRIASGAQPNNSTCAPGSHAGVLLDRKGGVTSFTLPGLQYADYQKVRDDDVVAAAFSADGRRLYVRSSESVEAYDFDPRTGAMSPAWRRQAPHSTPFFGMDQIAVHPDGAKVYVDGGSELLILDAASGRRTGSIPAGDATGVCFARVAPRPQEFQAGAGPLEGSAAPPP